MTSHWLFQLALLLVLLFWLVGAYNRLLRLRAANLAAWDQIIAALVKRSEAMGAVAAVARELLPTEGATLQSLADADAKQREAAGGVRQARARVADLSLWANAESALASPASRLRALIDLQPGLLQDPKHGSALVGALTAWRDAEPRLQFARQGYNDAVDRYNKAIHQWPAHLVASVFGFRSAGRA